MKTKLLMIFSLLWTLGNSSCPDVCNCINASILCIDKNLKNVPNFETLTDEPLIIDLSGNQISVIDDSDFSFMQNNWMKEIYLNNSEIMDIDSTAFEELHNLQELYLGDNLLTDISDELIEDLPNMILLDLSRNYFSGNMPLIRSKSLSVLVMANCKITNVPMDSLKYLPSLTILILHENNIRTIGPNVFDYITVDSFSLGISHNLWECTCENFELFKFLDNRKYLDRADPYNCISDNGEMNIFQNNNIEIMKSNCLSDGVLNDDSSYNKQNLLGGNGETSYSLIYYNNLQNPAKLEDSEEKTATVQYIVEDEANEVIKQKNGRKDIIKCPNISNIKQTSYIKVYHLELLVVFSVFFMGLILGCCLKQCISLTIYTKLKQSDSGLFNM